ncbi:hypothetical protein [Flavobacterium sp. LC2016-12]|uniref:hypothetical protein n=1 Tax=Flavobacterium sp. LC2016-12 TaxID=2783794 RepID=UPI00188A14FA|nr:hypothetical protein [Flavobacterium sp. LC2016-12]MBF4465338.1 hypothetical protein [Flavobacterium sp. LC2016-12]
MKNSEFEIHPFNEVFYIESLLNKTRSILNDVESVNNFWKNGNHDCQNDDMILDLFQNIILNAGGISRFFWPPKNKNSGHYQIRGEKLREVYLVSDSNILKNRDMRNLIEHFDENLDDFLKEFVSGIVMPKYVGPIIYVDDSRIFFRAYFYDKQIFKMLNVDYEIKPIIAEIKRIHEILLLQLSNGGRFK